jgi:hypothetical protein
VDSFPAVEVDAVEIAPLIEVTFRSLRSAPMGPLRDQLPIPEQTQIVDSTARQLAIPVQLPLGLGFGYAHSYGCRESIGRWFGRGDFDQRLRTI